MSLNLLNIMIYISGLLNGIWIVLWILFRKKKKEIKKLRQSLKDLDFPRKIDFKEGHAIIEEDGEISLFDEKGNPANMIEPEELNGFKFILIAAETYKKINFNKKREDGDRHSH